MNIRQIATLLFVTVVTSPFFSLADEYCTLESPPCKKVCHKGFCGGDIVYAMFNDRDPQAAQIVAVQDNQKFTLKFFSKRLRDQLSPNWQAASLAKTTGCLKDQEGLNPICVDDISYYNSLSERKIHKVRLEGIWNGKFLVRFLDQGPNYQQLKYNAWRGLLTKNHGCVEKFCVGDLAIDKNTNNTVRLLGIDIKNEFVVEYWDGLLRSGESLKGHRTSGLNIDDLFYSYENKN